MTDLSDLTARVTALTERVAALETGRAETDAPSDDLEPGELDTALLQRLQQRSGPGFDSETEGGAVLYAGAATVAGGSYVWQMERPVPGLLGIDDDLIADTLAAVSSPTRVRLLKAVLRGAREIHALQDALGGVSTGQLYHHLKELTAAGLVVQKGRGRYEVAPQTVVPVLAIIAAVYDLATTGEAP